MIGSYLGKHIPRAPATAEEIEGMTQELWQTKGKGLVAPEEIEDDWLRQGLINYFNGKYGKRREK